MAATGNEAVNLSQLLAFKNSLSTGGLPEITDASSIYSIEGLLMPKIYPGYILNKTLNFELNLAHRLNFDDPIEILGIQISGDLTIYTPTSDDNGYFGVNFYENQQMGSLINSDLGLFAITSNVGNATSLVSGPVIIDVADGFEMLIITGIAE